MAWIAVLAMGLTLGLLGGGGGILTLPILVNLFGVKPSEATGGSLLVVGATSLLAVILELRSGRLDWKSIAWVGIPAAIGSVSARKLLIPLIPAQIGSFSKDDATLLAFGLLMVAVAYRMFRPPTGERRELSTLAMILSGVGVGLLGGLLGAGGGFLIVPLLTLGIGLEMPRAVPTSLAIISTQSLAAVASDFNRPYPWSILGWVVGTSLAGMLVGLVLRPRVKAASLKTGFAYLVVAVAIFTFYKVGVNHFATPVSLAQ
jgi:uncharacterized membrane protein YfcA